MLSLFCPLSRLNAIPPSSELMRQLCNLGSPALTIFPSRTYPGSLKYCSVSRSPCTILMLGSGLVRHLWPETLAWSASRLEQLCLMILSFSRRSSLSVTVKFPVRLSVGVSANAAKSASPTSLNSLASPYNTITDTQTHTHAQQSTQYQKAHSATVSAALSAVSAPATHDRCS